jgi:hypothetical protein
MVSTLHAVSQPYDSIYLLFSECCRSSYPLTLLGNFVFSLATRFRLIPSSSGDVEIGAYTQVPGSARAEAERRRYVSVVKRRRFSIQLYTGRWH